MYDTISFSLRSDQLRNINLIDHISNYVDFDNEKSYNGNYTYTGNFSNFYFSVNDKRLSVSGSLCKYFLGCNLKTLNYSDIPLSIQMLSDDFKLPINKAKVSRIDIATNLFMKHPPETYYSSLGPARYFNRFPNGSGLYYNNHRKTMLFYDKIKEYKKKGLIVPGWMENRNVLRYEYRLSQQLNKQLKVENLTVADISDYDTYYQIITNWKNQYMSINKKKSILEKLKPTGSIKEFQEEALAITMSIYGYDHFYSLINSWYDMRKISRKQKSDLLTKIKKVAESNYYEANTLIDELDRKVQEAHYCI